MRPPPKPPFSPPTPLSRPPHPPGHRPRARLDPRPLHGGLRHPRHESHRGERPPRGDVLITPADTSRQRSRRTPRSEEHTSELQSPCNLVCRLLLEKKKHVT